MRRDAPRGDLIAAAHVQPRSGDVVKIGETRNKGADPVYTATGILRGSRPEAVAELEDALRAEGWDVVESRAVDAFLGWRIRATSDRMAANLWLGDVEPGPGRTSAYAPVEGAVHTQLIVGRRDSNWEWTQFED